MSMISAKWQAFAVACAILLSPITVSDPVYADQIDHRAEPGAKHKKPGMGTAGALAPGAARIIGSRFLDLDGHVRRLGDENGAGPVALVLLDHYCPISARYAPELNQ
ncbi:MAG: hypothetical protein ACR2RE_17120 [Geminicoccaceae bacterium]